MPKSKRDLALSPGIDLSIARREDLLRAAEGLEETEVLWLRHQIIFKNRVDILAKEVLGYDLADIHYEIIDFQFDNPRGLILAPRGFGKTTMGTVVRIVFEIIKNPDIHILLASRVAGNAEDVLEEVKGHFDAPKFIRVFGNMKGDSWHAKQITVANRKRVTKEPTVNTLGEDSAVVGKHYDLVICDDLVDEENSKTQHMRDSTRRWFYMSLYPTIKPGARFWVIGTRYHFDDIYGTLLEGMFRGKTMVSPALDAFDETTYPEKFSTADLRQKRRDMGHILFNAQFQNDVELMKGTIFREEWIKMINPDKIPRLERTFTGIDLAIGEKEYHDEFAIVTIGLDADNNIYVINLLHTRLTFKQQTVAIKHEVAEFEPMRTGIEANAYQKAQYQELRDDPDLETHLIPIVTTKDKVTRAWRLTKYFESGRVFVSTAVENFKDHLLIFPDGGRDVFDAFDMAVTVAFRRVRRKVRDVEPGVL